jgi:hypothetical protein
MTTNNNITLKHIIAEKGLEYLIGKQIKNIESGEVEYIHPNSLRLAIANSKGESFLEQSYIQRFYGGKTPESTQWIYTNQYTLV